jgi:hypothetical protein
MKFFHLDHRLDVAAAFTQQFAKRNRCIVDGVVKLTIALSNPDTAQ